jgi:hypothetical protein
VTEQHKTCRYNYKFKLFLKRNYADFLHFQGILNILSKKPNDGSEILIPAPQSPTLTKIQLSLISVPESWEVIFILIQRKIFAF